MAILQPCEWKHIALSTNDGVSVVTLHSDGDSLVWNARIHRELVDLWAWLAFDETTRVVVLTGAGQSFCDRITHVSAEKSWFQIWWEGTRLVLGMVELQVPIITVVNGPASIHAELAVLGDIVLAVPEASFSDHAHVPHGFVPGDGVQVVWRQLLGP